jgi:hypothetical protein
MLKGPEKQHILPRFYLDAFTQNYHKKGFLNVVDFRRGKIYVTKPSNIYEKGFYNLYVPDAEKYAMEILLAEIESVVAPSFNNVIKTGIFHGGFELGSVLSLVALIQARGEWMRYFLSNILPSIMIKEVSEGNVSEEKWNYYVESERAAGFDVEDWPSFSDLKGSVTSGFIPKAPEFEKVRLITELHKSLFDSLADHQWNMLKASEDSGGFICSTSPLVWSTLERGIAPWEHFILNGKDVFITFPLSSYYTLANGKDDGKSSTYHVSIERVAFVNHRTLFHSGGIIYCGSDEFFTLNSEMTHIERVRIAKGKLYIEKYKSLNDT